MLHIFLVHCFHSKYPNHMEIDNYSVLHTASSRLCFIQYLKWMQLSFTNNLPNIAFSCHIIFVGQRQYQIETLQYWVCKDKKLGTHLLSELWLNTGFCHTVVITYQLWIESNISYYRTSKHIREEMQQMQKSSNSTNNWNIVVIAVAQWHNNHALIYQCFQVTRALFKSGLS